jgi:putative transposase
MKGRFPASVPLPANVDTTWRAFFEIMPLAGKGESFMSESVAGLSETISKAKREPSRRGSPRTKSLKTSGAVSTSKGKGFEPYWTPSSGEASKRSLSLTETGSAGSDLSYSKPLRVSTTAGSWFSTTHASALRTSLFETSFQSSTSSPAVFTASGSTVGRSKKIRIYPKGSESLSLMKRYSGIARFWFNQAVEHLRGEGTKASLGEARKLVQASVDPEEKPWAFSTPQRIREHAISDACEAVKNAKAKFKKTGDFQQVDFRKRRDVVQGFGFDKISLKDAFVFRGSSKIEFSARESMEVEREGTRIKSENGRWFLIVPGKRVVMKPETQRLGTVAIDPGVRTFIAYFSPLMHGKMGEGDFKRIASLCWHLDNLMSRMSHAPARRRQRMKKAAERMRWKIRDLVSDLHKKAAHFFATRFDRVLLPTFEVSQMVSRTGRRLRSKTVRAMLSWAHFRFKQTMKSVGERYSCEVLDVNEAYTSKTCSYCGKIHNIGSSKVMKCCTVVDRDDNGARGIFLRALAAPPFEGNFNAFVAN